MIIVVLLCVMATHKLYIGTYF